MKYKKFGIIGAFAVDDRAVGGQTVKTKEFYIALSNVIGKKKVITLESQEYKREPIAFCMRIVSMFRTCESVVILPAQKGIRVLAPICVVLARIFQTRLHYNVIGAWIVDMVKKDNLLKKILLRFDSILVETTTVMDNLKSEGFDNVYLLENFKSLQPVEINNSVGNPLKVCYFSRISREKGIEDAIAAVNEINKKEEVLKFDIFGPVTTGYAEDFDKLKATFNKLIEYKGVIAPKDSVEILSHYDYQLFPTRYKTEGIPGSILDSFFAGTPIISARWVSFSDVIEERVTGFGYEQGNVNDLCKVLKNAVKDKDQLIRMKKNCLKESQKYKPETVISKFLDIAEGKC